MGARLEQLAVCLGLACSACSLVVEADDGTADDRGDEPATPIDPPDLDGPWALENVSATTTQMGFHPRVGIDGGRTSWVTWAETDEVDLGDSDIFVSHRSVTGWASLALSSDDEVQHTYPAIHASGDRLFVVWTGRSAPDQDLDVFVATGVDGAWSDAKDLTSPADPDARDDTRPQIVPGPDGNPRIVYISRHATDTSDTEVRVLDPGAASPVAETAITAPGCQSLTAVSDERAVHIMALCTGGVVYVSNESGIWLSYDAVGAGFHAPALAVDPGGAVHAVWADDDDIYYAVREVAGAFSTPINVSESDTRDQRPAVAADPFGRVVVAWGNLDAGDVMMSHGAGGAFSPPRNLTPQSPDLADRAPSIAIDPETGHPTIVIERRFSGSDPLNVDVFSLRLDDGS